MEQNPEDEYAIFIRMLSRMNSEEVLSALAKAKTGTKYVQGHLSLEVEAMAAGSLAAYIAALEAHKIDKLIDDSLNSSSHP